MLISNLFWIQHGSYEHFRRLVVVLGSRRDDLTKQTRKDHPAPSLRSSAVPAKRLSYGSTFTLIFL